MAGVHRLTIYRCYFAESDCYQSGIRQTSVGIQVHSTGANNPNLRRYVQPDDGRLGMNTNRNSHNRPGSDVCASAYIGKLADGTVAVYQTLPWDMRCWLSGSGRNGNANRLGYVGFEICEDDLNNEDYFLSAVMTAAVDLTAHLCLLFGTQPGAVIKRFDEGSALAVMDHQELSAAGLASGHADIGHWLGRYGRNMDDFRSAVAQAMEDGVEVQYVEGQEEVSAGAMYEIVSPNGGYVNLREQAGVDSTSLARLQPGDMVAVMERQDAWSRVTSGNLTGYVMNDFLRETEEKEKTEEPEKTEESEKRVVITDSVGNTFFPVGAYTVRVVID